MIKALFKVEKWLAPKSGNDTISIYTPQNSCGNEFSVGQSWLIFADYIFGRYTSDYCNQSVLKDIDWEDGERLLKMFRDLAVGNHDVNIELKTYDYSYNLIGRLEDGEPVGEWLKIRGTDTLAYYHFVDGSLSGTQMHIDDDTFKRNYYELERNDDTLIFKWYDQHMKLISTCEFRDGPFRVRSYNWHVRFDVAMGFRQADCQNN